MALAYVGEIMILENKGFGQNLWFFPFMCLYVVFTSTETELHPKPICTAYMAYDDGEWVEAKP